MYRKILEGKILASELHVMVCNLPILPSSPHVHAVIWDNVITLLCTVDTRGRYSMYLKCFVTLDYQTMLN